MGSSIEIAHPVITGRETAAKWASENPKGQIGEQGLETDTGYLKQFDGVNHWNDLPYSQSAGGGIALTVTPTTVAVEDTCGIFAAQLPVAGPVSVGDDTDPGLEMVLGPRGTLRVTCGVLDIVGSGEPSLSVRVLTSPDGSDGSWAEAYYTRNLTGITGPATIRSLLFPMDTWLGILPVLTGDPNASQVTSLVVDATSGGYGLTIDGHPPLRPTAIDVAATVQASIRGLGAAYANATVTGGPGNAGGSSPYLITFADDNNAHVVTTDNGTLGGGASTAAATTATPATQAPTADVYLACEAV